MGKMGPAFCSTQAQRFVFTRQMTDKLTIFNCLSVCQEHSDKFYDPPRSAQFPLIPSHKRFDLLNMEQNADATGFERAKTRYAIEGTIDDLMRRLGLNLKARVYAPDPEVEQRVRDEIMAWPAAVTSLPTLERCITTGILIATTFFGHSRVDVQVITGLYGCVIVMIDDLDVGIEALEEFSLRLCTGQEQLHPLLDCMAAVLGRVRHYYLSYAAQSIVISTIQFLNATAFDEKTKDMRLTAGAATFANYKRDRSGLGEAFGFLAFDSVSFPDLASHVQVIPESILLISYINDIFSLYKEEVAGETNNFVHDRMEAGQRSLEDALSEIVEECVAAMDRARQKLQGAAERDTFEDFIAGSIAYHLICPRYKLKDLLRVRYL